MPLQTDGRIVRNGRIRSHYFMLGIYCPLIADQIKPGQFVMLKVSDNTSPLLRRPFSVYKSYPASHPEKRRRGHLFILYKEVGGGTRSLALSLGRGIEEQKIIGLDRGKDKKRYSGCRGF
jgi:NAD(P)H-flavin reductase